jgi:LTXXQ motif family protein
MSPFKSATMTTLSAVAFAALVATLPVAAQPAPKGHGHGSQTPPRMGGGMMGMMDQGGMRGMMEMMGMMGAAHIEGRIAFLKAELKITDAQMPQWTTFADALRANAKRMSEMRDAMMQGGMHGGDSSMSALDRLDRMEKMMTTMAESVKATKAALAPLYAVLTDDQKKIADQLIHGPMGMGRM